MGNHICIKYLIHKNVGCYQDCKKPSGDIYKDHGLILSSIITFSWN